MASLLGTCTVWLLARDTQRLFSFSNMSPSPFPPLFFSSDLTSAFPALGKTYGKCILTGHMHADLFIGLRRGHTSASGFEIIPPLAWSPETLHNWQTCKSIACVKIAGRAWEPDGARVKSATVWLNQCEPCVVSTFQGLDNEKHTVYSLSCCLHSWLVWSQDSVLPETRPTQHRCTKFCKMSSNSLSQCKIDVSYVRTAWIGHSI